VLAVDRFLRMLRCAVFTLLVVPTGLVWDAERRAKLLARSEANGRSKIEPLAIDPVKVTEKGHQVS